ncbi:radical SAM protein [Kineosporia sp. NBRC 101731]|uniref:radical SAM protein n=1 Tax=Kineosporia sp. NBRC 101731 TaxID=3032199 RepID=UPI0024A0C584|nr:radical SAM protein [Kineosporia sp. NBRC 101731]GLY32168.1 pyruvate formate-lyase-activating enzyme [Kineosporia sp. NBRC 101731]
MSDPFPGLLLAGAPAARASRTEQPTGNIHAWHLTQRPPALTYELYLVLSGCALQCLNCPTPEVWDRSGGDESPFPEAQSRLQAHRQAVTGSGGGFTLTGGDPFAQPGFTAAVLRAAREQGYRTTLETPGYLGGLVPDTTLDDIGVIVLDLKTTDPQLFRRITRQDINPVLQFTDRLAASGREVHLSYLLIPGLNDSRQNIDDLARFVNAHANISRVEVMGFQHLGTGSYRRLGLPYELRGTAEATTGQIQRARTLFEDQGCITDLGVTIRSPADQF